jgi:hypothetical protein
VFVTFARFILYKEEKNSNVYFDLFQHLKIWELKIHRLMKKKRIKRKKR